MDIIESFVSDINNLSERFIQRMLQAIAGAPIPRAEMETLIAQADFFKQNKEVSARLAKFYNDYDDEIAKVLLEAKARGVKNLNAITIGRIEKLKILNFKYILGRASAFEDELRIALFTQITEGVSSKDIIDNLLPKIQSQMNYAPSWIGSVLNTAYQQYNSSSTGTLFKDDKDARFIIVGPEDIKTRASCDAVLAYQDPKGYTVDEINQGALTKIVQVHAMEFARNTSELETAMKNDYNFVNRGGINCRHNWNLL